MLLKKKMERRKFLHGLGGSMLALPLLEINASSPSLTPPKRITATGIFYGFVPENFHPTETGSLYTTPKLLKPLESLRQDYTVFSGLDHNLSGGHNATKFFLSGIPTNQSKGFSEANISMDQKAADFVGKQTRYSSLTLDTDRGNEHSLSWTRMETLSNLSEVLKNYTTFFFERRTHLIEIRLHTLVIKNPSSTLPNSKPMTLERG